MKVFVTGATGVLGRHAVTALLADGHHVTGLARSDEKARSLEAMGAEPVAVHLFDRDALTGVLSGYDAVCNLATHIPVGAAGIRPGAWRVNDRLRIEGSKAVAQAAREAGVQRLVQESVSLLYADGGEETITESSPLMVSRPLEPSAVAEANAAEFTGCARSAVILRFGNLVGDDAMTRWLMARARAGRAIGFGASEGWTHIVHPHDAGTAVAAALHPPPGHYNVGAPPLRRHDMLQVFGAAAEREAVRYLPPLFVKLAGERLEPFTRSHRVSSEKFHELTGWKAVHEVFDASWINTANIAA